MSSSLMMMVETALAAGPTYTATPASTSSNKRSSSSDEPSSPLLIPNKKVKGGAINITNELNDSDNSKSSDINVVTTHRQLIRMGDTTENDVFITQDNRWLRLESSERFNSFVQSRKDLY